VRAADEATEEGKRSKGYDVDDVSVHLKSDVAAVEVKNEEGTSEYSLCEGHDRKHSRVVVFLLVLVDLFDILVKESEENS
jgi:hypothetical protein